MTHKHNFKLSSYSINQLSFWCKCGERRIRPTTEEEQNLVKKYLYNPKEENIHEVWHKFANYFSIKNNGSTSEIKWDVNKLFDEIHKWTEKYPKYIRYITVYDAFDNPSFLILIENKGNKKYMGTTALYVPQSTDENPITFFLYPNATLDLIYALENVCEPSPIVVQVDDSFHSGSDLILTKRPGNPDDEERTVVIFIPQCSGEKPTKFLLHIHGYLIDALKDIRVQALKVEKAEEKAEREKDKEMNKIFKP